MLENSIHNPKGSLKWDKHILLANLGKNSWIISSKKKKGKCNKKLFSLTVESINYYTLESYVTVSSKVEKVYSL